MFRRLSTTVEMFEQHWVGVVEEEISAAQPGRVEAQATYWPARFYDQYCNITSHPTTQVTIVGRDGITLLVVPS